MYWKNTKTLYIIKNGWYHVVWQTFFHNEMWINGIIKIFIMIYEHKWRWDNVFIINCTIKCLWLFLSFFFQIASSHYFLSATCCHDFSSSSNLFIVFWSPSPFIWSWYMVTFDSEILDPYNRRDFQSPFELKILLIGIWFNSSQHCSGVTAFKWFHLFPRSFILLTWGMEDQSRTVAPNSIIAYFSYY